MDIDLARHVVRSGLLAGRDLEGLLAPLKAGCSDAEYREHARAIADAIHHVNAATIGRAIATYPELEAEVEASVAKYGVYL
jgi:hypothetical protein